MEERKKKKLFDSILSKIILVIIYSLYLYITHCEICYSLAICSKTKSISLLLNLGLGSNALSVQLFFF